MIPIIFFCQHRFQCRFFCIKNHVPLFFQEPVSIIHHKNRIFLIHIDHGAPGQILAFDSICHISRMVLQPFYAQAVRCISSMTGRDHHTSSDLCITLILLPVIPERDAVFIRYLKFPNLCLSVCRKNLTAQILCINPGYCMLFLFTALSICHIQIKPYLFFPKQPVRNGMQKIHNTCTGNGRRIRPVRCVSYKYPGIRGRLIHNEFHLCLCSSPKYIRYPKSITAAAVLHIRQQLCKFFRILQFLFQFRLCSIYIACIFLSKILPYPIRFASLSVFYRCDSNVRIRTDSDVRIFCKISFSIVLCGSRIADHRNLCCLFSPDGP